MSFPKSDERKKCWAARDDYWQCLEDGQEDRAKCTAQRSLFETNCTKQWVKYFDRRRDYLKYKEKMEKGGCDPVEAAKAKASM
ncbi:cytochrome c oxidase assembly factor 6 homolog [Babylonia areolata]|uniref:cytochrome c oxidase assembly factor 6 homolog n=1 Tax=Babylonia areolata TaxID=304850 RepID=UPI003FD40783